MVIDFDDTADEFADLGELVFLSDWNYGAIQVSIIWGKDDEVEDVVWSTSLNGKR